MHFCCYPFSCFLLFSYAHSWCWWNEKAHKILVLNTLVSVFFFLFTQSAKCQRQRWFSLCFCVYFGGIISLLVVSIAAAIVVMDFVCNIFPNKKDTRTTIVSTLTRSFSVFRRWCCCCFVRRKRNECQNKRITVYELLCVDLLRQRSNPNWKNTQRRKFSKQQQQYSSSANGWAHNHRNINNSHMRVSEWNTNQNTIFGLRNYVCECERDQQL